VDRDHHAAAAITHFLDCFLDFSDVEATHVRREREMLFVVVIVGFTLAVSFPPSLALSNTATR
jgi:hypothetical protein